MAEKPNSKASPKTDAMRKLREERYAEQERARAAAKKAKKNPTA